MAKLPETYPFGNIKDMSGEELTKVLQDMYRDLATAINRKPDIIERTSDGSATDVFLSNGDININTSTDKVEMITNHTSPTNVTWTQLS